MPIKQTLHQGAVPVHIFTDDIDHSAQQALLNIARCPIAFPHVAAMPDVHFLQKDIDQVMAHQTDLVEVVHTLRQVICIKG